MQSLLSMSGVNTTRPHTWLPLTYFITLFLFFFLFLLIVIPITRLRVISNACIIHRIDLWTIVSNRITHNQDRICPMCHRNRTDNNWSLTGSSLTAHPWVPADNEMDRVLSSLMIESHFIGAQHWFSFDRSETDFIVSLYNRKSCFHMNPSIVWAMHSNDWPPEPLLTKTPVWRTAYITRHY